MKIIFYNFFPYILKLQIDIIKKKKKKKKKNLERKHIKYIKVFQHIKYIKVFQKNKKTKSEKDV